jgi:hypothetical protein
MERILRNKPHSAVADQQRSKHRSVDEGDLSFQARAMSARFADKRMDLIRELL